MDDGELPNGTWMRVNASARPVAILGLASVLSGVVVGGVGGRIVMGVSARAAGPDVFGRFTENGNVVGQFTIVGTIALVLFVGLFGGAIGSVGVVASDPWLRWLGPIQGIGFGVVVMTVFGYDTYESLDFRILDPLLLNVVMFLGLFVAFGIGVTAFRRLLLRRLPPARDGEQVGWLIIVGLGAMPLFMSILFFTSSDFCGCDPAHEIGISLLVMVVSTAVFHASRASPVVPDWAVRLATLTGYASVTTAVAFGTMRTADHLQQLL